LATVWYAVANAQMGNEDRVVPGGGITAAGWKGKIDKASAGQGRTINDSKFTLEGLGCRLVPHFRLVEHVTPFVQRLPALTAGQRAAAVNLGIFPDSGDNALASNAPAGPSADRLADLEALLRVAPAPQPSQPATVQAPARTVQASYARSAMQAARFESKIWLQLASGPDDAGLSSEFRRLRSKNPDLFDGLKPYVARTAGGARLLVGPFRGRSDAEILAEDFATVGIDALNFTNSQADRIAPLAAE